jgi:3-oxoacyl-[acyl-carrier-protein] synthase-3
MTDSALQGLTAHLLTRLREVQENLGMVAAADAADARFADLLDSMGMVEFLTVLADDCGVTAARIEDCVDRQFGTVAELAAAMYAARLLPGTGPAEGGAAVPRPPREQLACWLGATVSVLPTAVQTAAALDEALRRPVGWLERHAGIRQRRCWGDEDPLEAAAGAARACLREAGLPVEEVGALLVTSEAPPLLAGLAAALHHRLDLRPDTVALQVGTTCTGYLEALWTARAILPRVGVALVVAVEAPTRWLTARPGPAGEAAALFGDGAAASVLCRQPPCAGAVPVADVVCGADGGAASLLRVGHGAGGDVEVRFEGKALAARAVRTMADAVRDLARAHGLAVADLEAVVAHGGNGRMPALLARRLGLPPERVWSATEDAGNLGAASLPVAWAPRRTPAGPVAWAAVGAGLTWGAALTGTG